MQSNNHCQRIMDAAYRIHEMSIATGPQGTLETLRIMAGLARDAMNYAEFCQFMRNLSLIPGRWPDAIDSYLRSIYQYELEQVETLYSPAYNVSQLKKSGHLIGDCDDIVMFYAAVFYALGYPVRMVAMRTKPNEPDFYHVVVEVKDGYRWKRYDATVPPGTVHIDYGTMIQYI